MKALPYLPAPPQTQALASKTFRPPPLDGSLSLAEIYDWHLENTPNHPLFIYAHDNGDLRTILYPEAVRAIHVGARLVRKTMEWQPGMVETPVVAILAASETISYFTMNLAIMRAGYTAFPISPRNSPAAVAHLISKVSVKHIFVGREQAMADLAKKAVEILSIQHPSLAMPKFSPLPLFEDLYLDSKEEFDDIPYENKGPDQVAIYLHSSGSTSFPKPIPWTNRNCIENCLIPYFGERDLTGVIFSLHAIPMYHGMGVLHSSWAAASGLIISVFEPAFPPQVPNPQNIFEGAVACNSKFILSVPAIIEEWSHKPEYVDWLSTREGVLYGGGPLNKSVGDALTSQGVSIFILYGSTECGIMSSYLPAKSGYDWDYFRLPGNSTPALIPQGDGKFELVLKTNPYFTPSVINTKVDGVDAYATSDLLEEHPDKPGYWRIYGRNDDQIIHSTGEKTNPGPLESMLNQDPHVQSSIMFGRGQFQAGVIIDPKPEFKFDPDEDQEKLAEFRNKIWPTVQKMNAFAPQHSRLFKEVYILRMYSRRERCLIVLCSPSLQMIMVSKPSKPFLLTAKNTIRRQATLYEYEVEINCSYEAVADSTQSAVPPPTTWDLTTASTFVRAVVNKVLSNEVKDEDDIFQFGCDSLQATWIRNTLLRALRDSAEVDTRGLVDNFVYENPTVSSMASFLSSLASGETGRSGPGEDFISKRAAAMRTMVAKYTQDYPVHSPDSSNSVDDDGENAVPSHEGDVVLLTGSTGALGCYILAGLVGNESVSRVYAVNRPSRSTVLLLERQANALMERGLDASDIMGSGKVKLVEADVASPMFGLKHEAYEEMRVSVTHIVHNAWPVDFNMALFSFDTSVKGVRNLVDFALSSPKPTPPTFVYTSSVGVFNKSTQTPTPLPEEPIPPEVAVGSGYTESKWVSEDILMHACKHTKLNSIIVRVGQLAGGTNGSWNIAEWFPALVQSSSVLGCFPTDHRVVDWIPLDLAAHAIIDFRLAGSPASSKLVHLVHPRPTAWASLAAVIERKLSVQLVPYSTWLSKLEAAARNGTGSSEEDNNQIDVKAMQDIPALRLLPFFRSITAKIEGSANAMGFPSLACEEAVKLSPNLSENECAKELNESDVEAWLGYWRRAGTLKY
ncbi:acetyl-CoA synthetase-like protein [Agrocybe pediades]|nr:acetyl-CoA synthetase-like protein [Agrocybe pediades]